MLVITWTTDLLPLNFLFSVLKSPFSTKNRTDRVWPSIIDSTDDFSKTTTVMLSMSSDYCKHANMALKCSRTFCTKNGNI